MLHIFHKTLKSNFLSNIKILTSFPLDLMKSISSVLNVAIDILLTRCGGVKPRLEINVLHFKKKYVAQTIVLFTRYAIILIIKPYARLSLC